MTIRRRLYWSNIMMLLIPITAVILFAIIINLTMDNWFNRDFDGERFYRAKNVIEERFHNFTGNYEDLKAEVVLLSKYIKQQSISLSICQDGDTVYSSAPEIPLLHTALDLGENHSLIFDNIAVYIHHVNQYTLVLTDSDYIENRNADYYRYVITMAITILTFMIAIILLTNAILTRILFKHITTPLDILEKGVRQISGGNLGFRIEYSGKDEFNNMCLEFNQMAERLQDMVNTRKKDEENRRELIAGISHDLRTPLTSIKAYVEGIEKGIASSPQLKKKYWETIKSKTSDLEHIIGQLFLFSKLDIGDFPLHLKTIDIVTVITAMVEEFSGEYAEYGLILELTGTIEPAYVKVDSVWIRSVFRNILENSVKYKISEQVQIQISSTIKNNQIEISIADNGPGVPSDALEKLFDVFYRVERSRNSNGSGLGLAISTKIIKLMDGTIHAENIARGGLNVIIILPVYSTFEWRDIDCKIY